VPRARAPGGFSFRTNDIGLQKSSSVSHRAERCGARSSLPGGCLTLTLERTPSRRPFYSVIATPRLIESADGTVQAKAERPRRRVSGLPRTAKTLSHVILPAITMNPKTLHHTIERARRFALQLPVYFRQPQSPMWMEGMTENISYTGVLFRSTHPLVPKTTLELRVQLAVGANLDPPPEIRCRGAVVRVEQGNGSQGKIAMAVSISDYRIVRGVVLK